MEKIRYPTMALDGKVAIVTGAAQGLGKWISLGLAHEGADLCVVDINKAGVDQTADEIEEMGRRAFAIEADLAITDSIKEMVTKTVEKFMRIDCLVNNAGINIRKAFLDFSPEDFDLVSNVNFKGVYFASQMVAKEMISKGGGKIINISSAAGYLIRPGIPNSVYAGTKGGVIMLTKALAEELAAYDIYVNAVAPGYFKTVTARNRLNDSKALNTILSFTPLKKIGEAGDIIGPVIFLASEASNFITGQTIFVDGGRSIL